MSPFVVHHAHSCVGSNLREVAAGIFRRHRSLDRPESAKGTAGWALRGSRFNSAGTNRLRAAGSS